jgi:hypothetical protein
MSVHSATPYCRWVFLSGSERGHGGPRQVASCFKKPWLQLKFVRAFREFARRILVARSAGEGALLRRMSNIKAWLPRQNRNEQKFRAADHAPVNTRKCEVIS